MKNKKTYDNLVYAILGTLLVGVVLMCANACSKELENAAPMAGEKKLDHATKIYEVEFDGAKYIVVQTYKGIGVCPKVEKSKWETSWIINKQQNIRCEDGENEVRKQKIQ